MPARALSLLPVARLRFRQAPLAAAALWFAAGICLEHWQASRDWVAPASLLLGAMVVMASTAAAALFWAHRAQRVAWVPVTGVWVALGLAAAAWHPATTTQATLLPYADNLSRIVRAHVVRVRQVPLAAISSGDSDQVQPWEAAEDQSELAGRRAGVTVDLAVEELEEVTPDLSRMIPANGGVRVSLYGDTPALACGDLVELPLRMKLPNRYRDPGAFQFADLLDTQGIAARASAAGNRVTVSRSSPSGLACRLFAAQGWASSRLLVFAASMQNRRLPPLLRLDEADARMLNAMLFGDRSGLTHSLRLGFERTGSFHLFVVSGMHIALLAGGVFWLLRRLRAPDWLATGMTLAAATAYAALTGFGQPAQRALGMTAVFLLTRLLAREHDRAPLNALGAAALAMLVWAPASLFETSFQMTVLAIVAIAGIAIPLGEWTFLRYLRITRNVFGRHDAGLAPRAAQLLLMLELWGEMLAALFGRFGRFGISKRLGGAARRAPALAVRSAILVCELALIAIIAELVMVLPMALYFNRAAVFALPANMFVVPLLSLLAPVAVATFVASLVSPWLALVPGAITSLLLHAITLGIRHVSNLGGADIRVPGPVWWVALLAVLGWGVCCWLARRGPWPALAAAILVPVIAAGVLWPERQLTHPGTLEITALDVGQGDGLLAVNPEGNSLVLDAGGPVGGFGQAEMVTSFDTGEELVSPYLWSRQLRRVDIVVLSHAHTDHMGGMPAVLENFRPHELWVGADSHSALFTALLAQAVKLGIRVRHVHAGDRVQWGSVEVQVLSPDSAYRNTGAPRNDDSVVLRMQYGRASALLEGDAEKPSEAAMVAHGFAPVTLLKVGHHGSKTSTTPEFLAMAHPQQAVISSGKGNTFGHPKAEIITRLAQAKVKVYRTDEMGLVSFLLAPDGTIQATTPAAESY